jgi:hypothetical protein
MPSDRELIEMVLRALKNAYSFIPMKMMEQHQQAEQALRDRLHNKRVVNYVCPQCMHSMEEQQPERTPPFSQPMKSWLEVTTPPKSEWTRLIKGVRVDGDTVVIKTKNNEAARDLCAELITENNA